MSWFSRTNMIIDHFSRQKRFVPFSVHTTRKLNNFPSVQNSIVSRILITVVRLIKCSFSAANGENSRLIQSVISVIVSGLSFVAWFSNIFNIKSGNIVGCIVFSSLSARKKTPPGPLLFPSLSSQSGIWQFRFEVTPKCPLP